MTAGLKLDVTNFGRAPVDSVTAPLNPDTRVIVTVYDALLPFCTDWVAGETEIVKSPTWVTTSDTAVVRVTFALVPRIVNEYVPAGVEADVDTVIVVDPEATTEAGLKDAEAPAGRPVTLKATVPVKPDAGVTVAV